jgi:leader peptidase (prepilin peptidase)/N-methyltransferase
MNVLIYIFIFFLGCIIGSFLNVVIYRFNTGKTVVNGRSSCLVCNVTLKWYELIPVFSFLIQSGRCRSCAGRISHQYPIVELITGIVFVLLTWHFSNIPFNSFAFLLPYSVVIFSLLIVISTYDIRHKIIPNKLVYAFMILSLLSPFLNYSGFGPFFIKPDFWNLLAGPIIALPFALIWLFSKGRLMGLGDAKLMLGLGWFLGLYLGLSAIVIAFWSGAIIGLIILAKKKVSMKSEIPFGPFLVFGALIAFICNLDIFSLSSIFIF